jgi:Flp pilus assembly protein TadG
MQLTQRKHSRGQAALEMALTLPILLMLSLPIMDFSWYFLSMQNVIDATQSGTRVASRTLPASDPLSRAFDAAASSLETSNTPNASAALIDVTIEAGDTVQVVVTVPYTPLTNFITMPTEISASHRMRLEHP